MPLQQSMILVSIFIALVAVALSQFNVPFALVVTVLLSGRFLLGPYLISRFSGVSAAAVSFRSIRGLRVARPNFQLEIDRLGFTFHLLRRKANRRIELRFEGVRLTVLRAFAESSRPKRRASPWHAVRSRFRRTTTQPAINDKYSDVSPAFEWLFGFLPDDWVRAIDAFGRRWLRYTAQTAFAFLIRVAPSLVSTISINFTSLQVVFSDLNGASISLGRASFGIALQLEVVPELKMTEEERVKRRDVKRLTLSNRSWRDRMVGGLVRTWEATWKGTKGTGSAFIILEKLTVSRPHCKPAKLGSDDNCTPSTFTFADIDLNAPDGAVLHIPGETRLFGSCQFDPAAGGIADHSGQVGLSFSDVTIFVDILLKLMDEIKALKPPPPPQSISSPRPSPPSSPIPSPLISPRRPTLSISSLFDTIPVVKPAAPVQDFRTKFGRAEVNIPRIVLEYTSTHTRAPIRYRGQMLGFHMGVRCSDPITHPLHRKWLGRGEHRLTDTQAAWLRFDDITINRHEDPSTEAGLVRILRSQVLNIKLLLHEIPSPLSTYAPSGLEPATGFVACEATLQNFEATETLDILRRRLGRSPNPKPTQAPRSESQTPLRNIPRIVFDAELGEVHCRTLCDDRTFAQDVGIDFHMEKVDFHLQTDFYQMKPPPKQLSKEELKVRRHELLPLQVMTFKLNAAAHAPCLKTCRALVREEHADRKGKRRADAPPSPLPYARLGAPSHGRDARYDDPFVAMEGLELHINGSLTGQFDIDNRLCLDPTSRLMDINLVADTLDSELCTVTSLEVISHFVNVLMKAKLSRRHTSQSPSFPTAHRSPINGLPSGVTVHAAIYRINVSATYKDLNPDCYLGVHRGILISTRLWVRYSSMTWDMHSHRTKWRTSQNNRRAQLGLKADVLVEALSKAAESKDPRFKSALMEVSLAHSTMRRIIGTEFGVEKSRRKVKQAALPLFASKIRTTIAFVRDVLKPTVGDRDQLQDQINITSDINSINSRIELSDIYCLLLAVETVNWVFNTRLREKLEKGKDVIVDVTSSPPLPPLFEVHASLNVGSIQIVAMLPLDQSITLKWGTLSASYIAPAGFQLQWQRLSGFVPSMLFLEEGRWEELGNIPSWTISVSKSSETGKQHIRCVGDAARIRIPHSYILADLVTSISVAAKAVKQLHAITTSGSFSQMPNPPPEEAKRVPNIEVSIDTLIFEATDTPIEAKLGLAFHQGLLAQRVRLEQEDAFEAKAALVEPSENQARGIREWNFTSEHTIGVDAARARLRALFSSMWINQLKGARDRQFALQKAILRKFKAPDRSQELKDFELDIYTPPLQPPIFRLTMEGVNIVAQRPDFDDIGCAEFMHKRGKGLPRGTKFTLLVPLHLEISLGSASVRFRDVPLPLLNIPPHPAGGTAVSFKTDLVIGEEVGPESSVHWIDCLVFPPNLDAPGTRAFSLSIPKTTMPVKTYADPVMEFTTTEITDICWGVSFVPIMQDAVKVIETLTTMSRDPSPPVGFWDKMRLVLHWRVMARFKGGLHFHMKGSRDPWVTHGHGAGFALCFIRNVQLHIGYDNPDNELIQINSNRVLIVIPNLKHFETVHTSSLNGDDASDNESATPLTRTFQKVLAKLDGGVRVGVGFSFERSCRQDCKQCSPSASPFHRQCRIFAFKPHYQVALTAHHEQSPDWDSFKDFRSDFIHMSLSLTTATEQSASSKRMNSVHLTPKTFTHFWHWKGLFNDALALPIRQGRMWPSSRPPSEKFGRHLATLKYRIQIKNLALSHAYKQDSLENIAKGDVPAVGVKGVINSFAADFHQRDQEVQIYDSKREQMRFIRSKPMYTAEVAMDGLDLRCILAIFSETPVEILAQANAYESPYAKIPFLASTEDPTFDLDDFVEVDWKPIGDDPRYFVGEIVNCPTFAFFKRVEQVASPGDPGAFTELSKFGDEATHRCLLKHEPSPLSVQVEMVTARIAQLKQELDAIPAVNPDKSKAIDLEYRISTLGAHWRRLVDAPNSAAPLQSAFPSDKDPWGDRGWEVYDNVYQFHTPKLTLTNSIRNVLLQYWYESRARRGFEWHMAGGAFTAIAKELQEEPADGSTINRSRQQRATDDTVRPGTIKTLMPPPAKRPSRAPKPLSAESETEPDDDWQFNVNLGDGNRKNILAEHSHYCILLKPQIVLRSELDDESVVILAANDMVLQLIDHMDIVKLPDPVKAYERTKIHIFLDGVQVFAPKKEMHEVIDRVRLPLELFVDEGCRSSDFEPIVRHTTLAVQYDRHNRLSNENQGKKDLIFVTTPRFTLQANSAAFASIFNVLSDVLLYADPSQRARLDRLEAFMLNDNLNDLNTVREEVKLRQSRIRDLTERISTLQLKLGDQLSSQGRMELALIQSDLTKQTDELGLIFDAVQINREKGDTKPGVWLEASSSDITWYMLDDSDRLLAKLSLKGLLLTWTSNTDGSTKNQLVIKDLQALDARPDAPFPEMLSKHRNWKDRNNKMVKADLLLRARWKTMPPVGGISILDDFKLRFHPLRIQIDASVGQKIQDYLFPKDRRNRFHSVETLDPEGRQPESPESPGHPDGSSQPAATFLKPRALIARSASHTDLRRVAAESTPGPRLHRTRSTNALHSDRGNGFTEVDRISLDHTLAEMRARSSENRTFVHANIRPSGLCLTFRRDKDMPVMIPDATELIYSTPEIEFENRTCSFRDLASEMKWKIYQEAFNAVVKGGAFKALNFTGLKEHKLFRHSKKPESSVVAASSTSSIAAPSAQRRLLQRPASRHTSRSGTPLNAGRESSAPPTRRHMSGDSGDSSTAASHGATTTSAPNSSNNTIVSPVPQRGTFATFFSRNRKRSMSVSRPVEIPRVLSPPSLDPRAMNSTGRS